MRAPLCELRMGKFVGKVEGKEETTLHFFSRRSFLLTICVLLLILSWFARADGAFLK